MKKGRRKKMVGADDAELAEGVDVMTNDPADESAADRIRGVFDGVRSARLMAGFRMVRSFVQRHRLLLVRTVLPAVYCLIFGGLGLDVGIYPFGISAVCAVADGKNAFLAAAGAALSSLFVRGGFYIGVLCAAAAGVILILRKFAGVRRWDTVSFRAILSAVSGGIQTLFFVLPGGVGFYDLCMILLSATVCPVLTVAVRGVFSADRISSPSVETGVCALFFSLAYFLRMLSPTGETVAAVISMLGVFLITYSGGMKRGILFGVAAGLAASPEYSFIYAAAATVSGVLMGVSPAAGTVAGALIALALGIYSGGAYAFGDLFPGIIFAVAIGLPLIRYKFIPVSEQNETETSQDADKHGVAADRMRAERQRLISLSKGLFALSGAMKKLAGTFVRPSAEDVRQMCDDAFDENCQLCENRDICWDAEYRSTAASISAMAAAARNGKTVDTGYFTEGMRRRCPVSDGITARINMGARSVAAHSGARNSTADIAGDYENMSQLVGDVAKGTDEDFTPDPDAAKALSYRLGMIGLRAAEVTVYGKRNRRVFVNGLEMGCSAGNDEIRSAAASVLGCRVTAPEYRINGGRVSMSFHTAEAYSVKLGRCSIAKKGESCGDCITSFKGDGGYFYTLISDGMGSGREAALTSGVTAVFLERMLSSGATLRTTMEMLNSFLSRRGTECFTTVDLMEADLITGELRFVKSGAAPSFILRGGRLFKLSSRTVPMGIVSPFDAERLQFSADAGDIVIMLSDGAIPDGEEPTWLYELICSEAGQGLFSPGGDPDNAAALIAKRAVEVYGGADDVTVGVAQVFAQTSSHQV